MLIKILYLSNTLNIMKMKSLSILTWSLAAYFIGSKLW